MKHRWPVAGIGIAVALALPALAGAQNYPEPKEPGKVAPKPQGPAPHVHGLQARL